MPISEPVLVTGWLINTNGTNDAVLTGSDSDGDIFPVSGLKVKGFENWTGANLKLIVKTSATFQITGTDGEATIYYENLKWSVEYSL